ncbi:AAA family ATPase [Inhella proteolytica]|uniref:ATP-binding protein n=1 Tax=Inhella proteolytica TaxID=2795029 RepID=A0A931J6D9_9BURK|nr:ATP-binding protein [Inhella proteolytica]MBH9579101.1 ATP-binding protein [Inhella proteolytica]
MPIVRIIEGPVGAGKSTFSASLASRTGGVHIALDAWFAKLFSPDRPTGDFIPWYVSRKDRLLDLIWIHSQAILTSGSDVILELGLIQRQPRMDFCRKVMGSGFGLLMYELDAPREERWARVQRRNSEKGSTFSMVVPAQIFELASNMWEPSDSLEREEYEIELVSTGSCEEGDG